MPQISNPTLNAEARAFVAQVAASGRRPFQDMTPDEARTLYRSSCAATGFRVLRPTAVEDIGLSAGGGNLRARLYRPETCGSGADPAILYVHGGGWVLGDISTHDPICHLLAQEAEAVVVSVEYRLAPEHPFPAAFDDVMAWYRRLVAASEELGIDPARIAVAGDSAGGALAASAALALRGGSDVAPRAQVLFYPVTDIAAESAGYARATEGLILTAATMRWFKDSYARPGLRADWRASPSLSPSLRGAAPALVVTAAHDPLCEEGLAYARRLESEAVPTTLLHLGHHMHAFLTMGGVLPTARAPLSYAAQFLRASLEGIPS